MRISAFVTAASMVIVAASLGVAVYLALGFSFVEALASALTLLTALVAYNTFAGRAQDQADVAGRVADLSHGTADLARQVGDIGRRVVALEQAAAASAQAAQTAVAPLSAEIGELGVLVNQLAESVAAHEAALVSAAMATSAPRPAPVPPPLAPAPAPAAIFELAPELLAPPAAPVAAVPAAAAPAVAAVPPRSAAPSAPPPQTPRVIGGRFHGMARDDLVQLLRGALEANRLDLHLQPIVTLPQRKVRYYEALARLRMEDGELVAPTDFLGAAEAGGLLPALDHLMLFRCMQVVRRLTAKNRDIGVFCNLAAATLTEPTLFAQFCEFLAANKAMAPNLMFEFGQRAWRAMGTREHESLAVLARLGFRFSLDRVADLDLAPSVLAAHGFRCVKVPAALLLDRTAAAAADIDVADLASLLARAGIELIADKIETEAMVVDILDYDVAFGQGLLFSPPRALRAEALAAPAEAVAAPPPADNGPAPPPDAAARANTVLAQIAQEMARRA